MKDLSSGRDLHAAHNMHDMRGIALLLAALSTIGPFAMDTYLPSLHSIGESLRATPLEVQQTLTAYLFMFSLMSLWHGAISDALGRRRVILVSLAVFMLACAASLFATRIGHLWLLRAIQGMSAGAGVILSRAIVRDLFQGPSAQRMMSHMTMMFAIAPAAAPVIGGHLQTAFGWRSVFAFMMMLAAALLFACWRHLPETLPVEQRQPLNPGYLLRIYWRIMTSPVFLAASLGLTCIFSGFFIYIMSAPEFLVRHLGLPETAFLWLFGPAMAGMLGGAWLSGKAAGRIPLQRTILYGFLLAGLAALLNLGINLAWPPALPLSILPMPLYTLGMALIMPSLTLLALDHFPQQRGTAASCQNFIQSMGSSLVAGVIAPIAWQSTFGLAVAMSATVALAALSTAAYFAMVRSQPAQ